MQIRFIYIYFFLFNVHVSQMQGDIKIENRNQLCILVLSERRHCESEHFLIKHVIYMKLHTTNENSE